ncbi:MAG: antitoxin Xre/MbcA/ParS toxin-binding domain-containing protein [Myxococcota bacterium]
MAEPAPDLYQETYRLLGGMKTLKTRRKSPDAWVSMIRRGFRPSTLTAISDNTGVPVKTLLSLISLPERTWARKTRNDEPLSLPQSDRLYRIARAVARATEVFESRKTAVDWLRTDNRALSGQTPFATLDTEVGEEQVRTLLGRIEYGVYT